MVSKQSELHATLIRYLRARGIGDRQLLEELGREIATVVRKQVSFRQVRDGEDVAGDCVVSLLCYVHKLKESGDPPPDDFRAYVYRAIANHVSDSGRRAFPERHQIGLAIRHVLNNRLNCSGFAMWVHGEKRALTCGFDAWNGQPPSPPRERLDRQKARNRFSRDYLGGADPVEADLADTVAGILNRHGAPLAFSDLVDLVCELREIERADLVSLDAGPEGAAVSEMIADLSPAVEENVTERMGNQWIVRRTWVHLKELEPHQLIVYCFPLERDELMALVLIVGAEEMAAAMAMELDEWWCYAERVPIPDEEIARITGRDLKQIPAIRFNVKRRILRRSETILEEDLPEMTISRHGPRLPSQEAHR